jgi:acyl-CoA reductase-like NAD-dependent aldehyde dehydrogenase
MVVGTAEMFSCTIWCFVGVIFVALGGLKLFSAIAGIVLRKYERMTSPVVEVPRPQLTFTSEPAKEPLHPRAAGEGKIQCFDKGTNQPLGVREAMTKSDVKAAIERARVAQVDWAKSSFATRRRLMFALMDFVLKEHETICRTSAVECGKTMLDGTLGEILTTLEKLSWTAHYGEKVLQEEVREVGLIAIHKRASVSYLPLGVVSAIVSWNYPFHNIIGPMISALFAGNGFVGKVSEWSCYYANYYQEIVRSAIVKLGYSADLVTFVTGYAEAGEALVELTDKVTFIGSPQVGKLVMRKASETLTPVLLELGGKDPAVVCDDADLAQLIPVVMRGTFQNCGQNCVGLERVVVHAKIYDVFVERLRPLVAGLTQGATTTPGTKDCGAMTMGEAAIDKIDKLVQDAVKKGAKCLAGGKKPKASANSFYPPTMLVNVTTEMEIAQEEVFGPVLVIFKAENDEDAIRIVNTCPYGLGSSVFSRDQKRAHAIGRRLRTGMMNINDFGINYLCQSLPFGGTKISGFDRFAGVEGLRGNCLVRSETRDRIPGVKTEVPLALQYPVSENSFKFSVLLCRVLYAPITGMLAAVIGLITFKK